MRRDIMAKNSICHFEWIVADIARAKRFYGGLFGWEFEAMDDNYLLFTTKDGLGGAFERGDKVEPGNSPIIYIEVDEIEDYYEKTKELGGDVKIQKREIPNHGWYAILTDPDGNNVGLYQALPK